MNQAVPQSFSWIEHPAGVVNAWSILWYMKTARFVKEFLLQAKSVSTRQYITLMSSLMASSEAQYLKNYTIMVPPKLDVYALKDMRKDSNNSQTCCSVVASLMLHVLRGHWTIDDLVQVGKANGCDLHLS